MILIENEYLDNQWQNKFLIFVINMLDFLSPCIMCFLMMFQSVDKHSIDIDMISSYK